MKISEKTIKYLGRALCGDKGGMPYKSGQELVNFFVEFGANDRYEEGFPSRWKYTEDKVREYNNTDTLRKIIEASLDPRDYLETVYEPKLAAELANEYLKFDGYELKEINGLYKITDANGILVEPKTVKGLNHDFINEQITKCHDKIEKGDYNGAITNARSMLEAVMIEIIEEHDGYEYKNDGNLDNMYKKIKQILNLTIDPKILPPTVLQILSGLNSITNGLAGLSNNSGDRHANKFKTKKHHARLAVNASMTLVDFLLDSREYQRAKN